MGALVSWLGVGSEATVPFLAVDWVNYRYWGKGAKGPNACVCGWREGGKEGRGGGGG